MGHIQLLVQIILHVGNLLRIRDVDVDQHDVDAVLVHVAGVLAHAVVFHVHWSARHALFLLTPLLSSRRGEGMKRSTYVLIVFQPDILLAVRLLMQGR